MNGRRLRLTLMSGDFNIQQNSRKTMKKISLEMLRLTSDEVLERSQMKKITGGYGICTVHCYNPSTGKESYHSVPVCSVGCPQGMGLMVTGCNCS
jgi:natural product precursor